jgi:hypothetical protein
MNSSIKMRAQNKQMIILIPNGIQSISTKKNNPNNWLVQFLLIWQTYQPQHKTQSEKNRKKYLSLIFNPINTNRKT